VPTETSTGSVCRFSTAVWFVHEPNSTLETGCSYLHTTRPIHYTVVTILAILVTPVPLKGLKRAFCIWKGTGIHHPFLRYVSGEEILLWRDCVAKELDETIQENAEGPAEMSGDSGAIKQHPLKDQIGVVRCCLR